MESVPPFDECVDDLPMQASGGPSKGKEMSQPSLLGDEEEVVALLRSIIFKHDMRCYRGNSTNALAKSTYSDFGQVSFLSFLNPFIILLIISDHLSLQMLTKLSILVNRQLATDAYINELRKKLSEVEYERLSLRKELIETQVRLKGSKTTLEGVRD